MLTRRRRRGRLVGGGQAQRVGGELKLTSASRRVCESPSHAKATGRTRGIACPLAPFARGRGRSGCLGSRGGTKRLFFSKQCSIVAAAVSQMRLASIHMSQRCLFVISWLVEFGLNERHRRALQCMLVNTDPSMRLFGIWIGAKPDTSPPLRRQGTSTCRCMLVVL